MRFIDKSQNRAAGIEIVSSFLQNHCQDPDGRNTGIRYNRTDNGAKETFSTADRGKYRKALTRLLLSEQNNLCCYCLRRLKTNQNEDESDSKITLEHIIPRSYTSADNASYYRTAPGLSCNEIEITDTYESAAYHQQLRIHPHKVAYNNLTVSCNGTFPDALNTDNTGKQKLCCNIKRGTQQAYPVYFLPDVANFVKYLSNGDIQAVVSSPEYAHVVTLINSTNLQCDSLKDIRYLWYILRGESWSDIYTCCSSHGDRYRLLTKTLFVHSVNIELAIRLSTKFHKDNNWETFMLYSAFYDIMRLNYPPAP